MNGSRALPNSAALSLHHKLTRPSHHQLFLAVAAAGPWFLIVIYDFLYYIFRVTTYEIPVIGGRARGRQRPRAPSLVERPDGSHRRGLSLGGGSRDRGEGEEARDDSSKKSGTESVWKVAGDINGEWDGAEELRRRTLAGGVVGAGSGEQEDGMEGGEWDVRLRGRQI